MVTELEWNWEPVKYKPCRAWKQLEVKEVKEEVVRGGIALGHALQTPPLETKEAIDIYLSKMIGGFKEIIDLTVPWAKPHPKAKSFWNPECTRATTVAKARRKTYRHSRCPQTEEDLRMAELEKVSILKKTKRLQFREGVHEVSLRPTGVWNLARWGRERSMKPWELPQFPAIKDGNGGKASAFDGKVKALTGVLFPPLPQPS